MSTRDVQGHEDFEGLAAGYALHALEPEDEQRLAAHLLTCQDCARIVADAAAVGAAFADLVVEDAQPSAGLRDRILAAAAAEPRKVMSASRPRSPHHDVLPQAPPGPEPRVVSRDHATKARRFQVRSRILVGALAAVIGVGIAVPVTLSVSGGSSGSNTSAFAAALLQKGAREVTLTGDSRTSAAAKAVVSNDGVYLVADGLPKNDKSNSIYVLWMQGGSGDPVPVATFDVHNSKPVMLKVSNLPLTAAQIKHVAVSEEPGRKAPVSPTDIVVQGTAV